MQKIRSSFLKYSLCLSLSCLSFSIHAEREMALDQSFDPSLQSVIHHYLKHQGKAEGVTGIAASISFPKKNHKDHPVIQTYVAGQLGYAPYTQRVTPHYLFEIGSITKSFTAMLILQLQAEGALSLDDPIGKWLPQYPEWQHVTIKQLLNMTSNIQSYSENDQLIKKIYHNIRIELSDKALLTYSHPEQPLSPELKFDYSNSNYILAGLIIEAITHQSFAEVLQKRLLHPYHLKNTYYVAGPHWKKIRAKIMPRMVHGYYYDKDKNKMIDVTDSNLSWAGPAGGIVSDTRDMITWINVLYHGLAIPQSSREKTLAELESVVSMKTGKPISTVTPADPKGFGLGVGFLYTPDEGRFWVYEGSGMGYRMMYLWRQCNDISVVAALNSKGGEGAAKTNANGGDHIQTLVIDLYKKIIADHPEYNCKD